MKITKTANRVDYLNDLKNKANIDCNKCPHCGKEFKGFKTIKQWAEGFFNTKYYQIDCYWCDECGCEWESEKYEK